MLAALAALTLAGCSRFHHHPPPMGGHGGGPMAGMGGSPPDSGVDAGDDSGVAGMGGAGESGSGGVGGMAGGESGSGGSGGMGGTGGAAGEPPPPPNTPTTIDVTDGHAHASKVAGTIRLSYVVSDPDGVDRVTVVFGVVGGSPLSGVIDSLTPSLDIDTRNFPDGAIFVRLEVLDARGATVFTERTLVVENLDQRKNCADRITLSDPELMLPLPSFGFYQPGPLFSTCTMRWPLVAYESVLEYHGLAYPACVTRGLRAESGATNSEICQPYLCVPVLPAFPNPEGVGEPAPGLHDTTLTRQASIEELVTELDNGRVVVIGDAARPETFVVYGYVRTPSGILFWISGSGTETSQGLLAAYSVLQSGLTSLMAIAEPPAYTWNYSVVHLSARADGCVPAWDPMCAARCTVTPQ